MSELEEELEYWASALEAPLGIGPARGVFVEALEEIRSLRRTLDKVTASRDEHFAAVAKSAYRRGFYDMQKKARLSLIESGINIGRTPGERAMFAHCIQMIVALHPEEPCDSAS